MKKIIAFFATLVLILTCTTSIAFANESANNINKEDCEQYFDLVFYDDEGNVIQPRINADGSFTYSFTTRLHSSHFTADADKITINFKTTTNSKSYYYIALYDVTKDPVDPTFKSMTQAKDDTKSDSKTFNVKKGNKYRLTFQKVNPRNTTTIKGSGTISGIKK